MQCCDQILYTHYSNRMYTWSQNTLNRTLSRTVRIIKGLDDRGPTVLVLKGAEVYLE